MLWMTMIRYVDNILHTLKFDTLLALQFPEADMLIDQTRVQLHLRLSEVFYLSEYYLHKRIVQEILQVPEQ
jgi:hypothetical protein